MMLHFFNLSHIFISPETFFDTGVTFPSQKPIYSTEMNYQHKRIKMKKKIYSFLTGVAVAALFTGCGGGGGTTTSASSTEPTRTVAYQGDIALWDYLVPAADATNSYIKTNGTETKKYQTRFSRSTDGITEISELSPNEKTLYTNNGNTIEITFYADNVQNGSVTLKSKVNINDIVTVKTSDCRLKQRLASFTYAGNSYSDVIEIVCGDTPGYYQKGVGEILQQKSLSPSGTVETKILENEGK
jgi:hypothetical protein